MPSFHVLGFFKNVPDCSCAELSGLCGKHLPVTYMSQASSLTVAKCRGKEPHPEILRVISNIHPKIEFKWFSTQENCNALFKTTKENQSLRVENWFCCRLLRMQDLCSIQSSWMLFICQNTDISCCLRCPWNVSKDIRLLWEPQNT